MTACRATSVEDAMRRRLFGITGGLVLSLIVAGTAFADSCAHIIRAAPDCHPG